MDDNNVTAVKYPILNAPVFTLKTKQLSNKKRNTNNPFDNHQDFKSTVKSIRQVVFIDPDDDNEKLPLNNNTVLYGAEKDIKIRSIISKKAPGLIIFVSAIAIKM